MLKKIIRLSLENFQMPSRIEIYCEGAYYGTSSSQVKSKEFNIKCCLSLSSLKNIKEYIFLINLALNSDLQIVCQSLHYRMRFKKKKEKKEKKRK